MGSRYPEGLVILDMENPACLQRLGGVEIPRSGSEVQRQAVGVGVADQQTYLVSTGTACDSGTCHSSTNRFHVIDTSDPACPRLLEQYDIGQLWVGQGDIGVSGTYAFVNGGHVFDCRDPVHPTKVGQIDVEGQMVVSGTYLYAIDWRGFHAFDIGSLQRVGLLLLSDRSSGLAVEGIYAFLAGDNLEVIDISQPANPRRVGGCAELGGGYYGQIAVAGGRACVVGDGLLRVFDVSDPANPRMTGECSVSGRAGSTTAIVVAGDCAYVAAPAAGVDAPAAGVEVFDIRDPAYPRRVGGNSAFDAHALAIADGRLHVAAGGQGLAILSLYQPPRLESLRWDAQGFHLLLRGPTGQMMRLDRSRDLRIWEPFATIPIPASGQTLIDPAATTEPYLFYRAVSVP